MSTDLNPLLLLLPDADYPAMVGMLLLSLRAVRGEIRVNQDMMSIVMPLSIIRHFWCLGLLWFFETVLSRTLRTMLFTGSRVVGRRFRLLNAIYAVSVDHLVSLLPTHHRHWHLVVHILVVTVSDHGSELVLLLHWWERAYRNACTSFLLSHANLGIIAAT